MQRISYSVIAGAFLLAILVVQAPRVHAQDKDKLDEAVKQKLATLKLLEKADEEYRTYFKRPEKVHEFWVAIKFEIDLGKFDLAALHLKQMLEVEPAANTDKELVKIEEAEGMSTFLRLQTVRKWSDNEVFQKETVSNVAALLQRVTTAVETYLNDGPRLNGFIDSLTASTEEERSYAFSQLRRAREKAAPYLVEALRNNVNNSQGRVISNTIVKLDAEIMPPVLEVLKAHDAEDARDVALRMEILDIVKRRAETRAIPYLWHLAGTTRNPNAFPFPPIVRARAKELLASFLETAPGLLPSSESALVELANKYYLHKAKLGESKVRVWPWDGAKLALKPIELTPSQAEEFYGLRYSKEALDLDPSYLPAQIVLLSLTLERNYAPRLNEVLLKSVPPGMRQLLGSIDPDLIATVLERAMDEGNVPVIVATVQALGERGDARAARMTSSSPHGLIRALFYPDRRVQFAAMKAILHMPGNLSPVVSARIVELARRFLNADAAASKALAVSIPADKAAAVRSALASAGFAPVLVNDIREGFVKLSDSAAYDLLVLYPPMSSSELPYVLSQVRGDADNGKLPIVLLSPAGQEEAYKKQTQHFGVRVVPEIYLTQGADFTKLLDTAVTETSGPKLSPDEHKEFANVSLAILWQMAHGEIQGFDVRPAQPAIVEALRNPDFAVRAIETLGYLPGPDVQQRLASIVLNTGDANVRMPAALELNRHIQKYGVLLAPLQMRDFRKLFEMPNNDPALRSQLALVVGSFNPGPQLTGSRLLNYTPELPIAPMPPVVPAPPQEKE